MTKVLLVAPAGDFTQQVLDALAEQGHTVTHIDDRLDYALPQTMRPWRWLWRISRRIPFLRRRSNRALQMLIVRIASDERPELLLATKGMNIRPQTLAIMRQAAISTAVWFADNAANEPYATWVRTTGVVWDYFFSFDSAIYEQMPADAHGHVHVLPFGVNPNSYESSPLTEDEYSQYACDVCFIGAPYPDRVKLLEKVTDLNVKIWGWSGWNSTSLRNRYLGPLNSQQSAKAYRAAKICVNTNIQPRANGVNLKTFEICAAGGFQLTDEPVDLGKSYEIGPELDVFHSPEEFESKVRFWLGHDAQRRAVARAGHERTIREHDIRLRMKRIIEIVA